MSQYEKIARVCHQANKAYCESIGDYSQMEWNDAPEWQRESAMNGVEFHLTHPEAKDDASHNNWMREKVDSGWIYGEVKDPEKKTHPCIVPFNKLPLEQQRKDSLFRAIVHALR